MSQNNEISSGDSETIKEAMDQVNSLQDHAAQAGVHIEVYVPPSLAEWILDMVIEAQFRNPSEAALESMTRAKELDLHEDLKSKLFKRSIEKRLKGDRIPVEECITVAKPLSNKASTEKPDAWKPALRLKVLSAALELMNGDSDQATIWVNTPLEILGNKTPIEYVTNKEEFTDLKVLVGRLKHGIFS